MDLNEITKKMGLFLRQASTFFNSSYQMFKSQQERFSILMPQYVEQFKDLDNTSLNEIRKLNNQDTLKSFDLGNFNELIDDLKSSQLVEIEKIRDEEIKKINQLYHECSKAALTIFEELEENEELKELIEPLNTSKVRSISKKAEERTSQDTFLFNSSRILCTPTSKISCKFADLASEDENEMCKKLKSNAPKPPKKQCRSVLKASIN